MNEAKETKEDTLQIPTDWTFKNKSVADNFDTHVREQLPWYTLVTGMIGHLGRHYIPSKGVVYDLGASTGNITRILEDAIVSREAKAISIDYSTQMQDVWRGVGEFVCADIRDVNLEPFDFAVCFLVLMFLPPADQKETFKRILGNMKVGGAVVLFDKVEANNGYVGTVLHRLAIASKVSTGVSSDDIIAKELSLAGQQRPISESFVMDCIGSQPFQCQSVFRFGEFAGWLITR